tara:strand:+ start:40 stop:150 length:111 start_codon:yes stop_codon:yes gene_type:complete
MVCQEKPENLKKQEKDWLRSYQPLLNKEKERKNEKV